MILAGWISPDGTHHPNESANDLHSKVAQRHFPGTRGSDGAFAAGWMHTGDWKDDEGHHLAGYTHEHEATAAQIKKLHGLAKSEGLDQVHFESGGRTRVLRLSREPKDDFPDGWVNRDGDFIPNEHSGRHIDTVLRHFPGVHHHAAYQHAYNQGWAHVGWDHEDGELFYAGEHPDGLVPKQIATIKRIAREQGASHTYIDGAGKSRKIKLSRDSRVISTKLARDPAMTGQDLKKNPSFNKTTFASHLGHVWKTGTGAMKGLVKRIATGKGVFSNGSDAYRELGTALKQSNDPTHLGIASKYNWNRMSKTAELDRLVSDVLKKHNVKNLDEDDLYHRAGADTNRGKVVKHLLRYLPTGPMSKEAFKGVLTEDHLHKSLMRLREGARDRLHGGRKAQWDALLDATAKEHAGVVVQKALEKERAKTRTALRFSREDDEPTLFADDLRDQAASEGLLRHPPTWDTPENRKEIDRLLEATDGHGNVESVAHLGPLVDFLLKIRHPAHAVAVRATMLPGGETTKRHRTGTVAEIIKTWEHPYFHPEKFNGTTFPGIAANVAHSTLPFHVRFRSPHTHMGEIEEIAKNHPDAIRRYIARGALNDESMDWHRQRVGMPMRPRPIYVDHTYSEG